MRRLAGALLGLCAAVAVGAPSIVFAAYSPYPFGNAPGSPQTLFSHSSFSDCTPGNVCTSPFDNTCLDGGTAVCHVYNWNGGSSTWSRRYTYNSGGGGYDMFGVSLNVYNHANGIRNHQSSSGRTACAYDNISGAGGVHITVTYAGPTWVSPSFTGFTNLATIPNSANWVCYWNP